MISDHFSVQGKSNVLRALTRIAQLDQQVWEALAAEERTEERVGSSRDFSQQRKSRKQMLAFLFFWIARALYRINKLEDAHVCALRCMGLMQWQFNNRIQLKKWFPDDFAATFDVEDMSATKIQNKCKYWLYRKTRRGISALQSCFRGSIARRDIVLLQKGFLGAFVTFQALARGALHRKNFQRSRAILQIQSRSRQFLVRMQIWRQENCLLRYDKATYLQSIFRSVLCSRRFRRKQRMCIFLQAKWRGYIALKNYAKRTKYRRIGCLFLPTTYIRRYLEAPDSNSKANQSKKESHDLSIQGQPLSPNTTMGCWDVFETVKEIEDSINAELKNMQER